MFLSSLKHDLLKADRNMTTVTNEPTALYCCLQTVCKLYFETRMHSSRLRTARCSGRLSCHAHCPTTHAHMPPLPHIPPAMHDPLTNMPSAKHGAPVMHTPRRQDRQTLVKTLPSLTSLAGGNS